MKNLYVKYLVFFVILLSGCSYGQTYITWNLVNHGLTLTGTATSSAGIVNVSTNLTPGINFFEVNSPATHQPNLQVTGAQTFSTYGPGPQDPSVDLIIDFDRPVIVTRYNMADIDMGNTLGGSWNDTFNFNGINFTNNPAPTAQNCIANLNGAIAWTYLDWNLEYASWFCSNPVTTFTIDYQTTGGATHAYLGYSIQVLIPPSINQHNTLCLNDPSPPFPIVGNNISGTWNPETISTNTVGITNYIFTPAVGQPIQCPINMTVTVTDCCQATLILTPADSMTNISPDAVKHRERSDWIRASNMIGIGDFTYQNAVVYHAENFVDLIDGFDAINGSQFAAYPEGCSGNYSYKNINPQAEIPIKEEVREINVNKPSIFNIYAENELLKVALINLYSNDLKIYSLDGKIVYQNNFINKDSYEIDISSFAKGVYIISAIVGDGYVYSEKFIKN